MTTIRRSAPLIPVLSTPEEKQQQEQSDRDTSKQRQRRPNVLLLGHEQQQYSISSGSRRPSVSLLHLILWISLLFLLGANLLVFWSSRHHPTTTLARVPFVPQNQRAFPAHQHPIATALESFVAATKTSVKRKDSPTRTTTTSLTSTFSLAKLLADKIIIPTNNNSSSSSSATTSLDNPELSWFNNATTTTNAAMSIHEFPYQIAPWAKFSRKEVICFPWYINYDVWWTHHVTWRAASENDTHYCFEPIPSRKRVKLYRTLHDVQYGKITTTTTSVRTTTTTTSTTTIMTDGGGEPSTSNHHCSLVFTQQMFSSGWGADMAHVVDAMEYALQHKVPMQVSMREPWHYAGVAVAKTKKKQKKKKKNTTTQHVNPLPPVCPHANMYCYFLNLTDCPPNHTNIFNGRGPGLDFWQEFHPNFQVATTQYLIDYATRPQTWLRKAVYDFVQQQLTSQLLQPLQQQQTEQQPQQCIVVHVRRSDVVLHHVHSRRYHELEEYMAAIPPQQQQQQSEHTLLDHDNTAAPYQQSILLLTDDATVIEEALTKYPQYHWIYIRRPRFKGPEGGFENHIPSADPKLELLVLLSLFQFIPRHCTGGLIHTMSNLGQYVAGILLHSPYRRRRHDRDHDDDTYNTTIINLDAGLHNSDIFNANYSVVKR